MSQQVTTKVGQNYSKYPPFAILGLHPIVWIFYIVIPSLHPFVPTLQYIVNDKIMGTCFTLTGWLV
jgi:hypothetical protein